MIRRSIAVVVAASAFGVAGCSDGDSGGATGATTTTTEAAPMVDGLDFAAGSEVELDDGWVVAPCESGPPLFCAKRAGSDETESVIELMEYPTASYSTIKEVLRRGGSSVEALRAEAAEFHEVFAKDRPSGCGSGYRVEPFGPDDATVAGRPGVVYGFDGHQGGRRVERALQFATIEGDTVAIIATSAVEDGTCMDDGERAEFAVAELADLQPAIIQMVAASRLP
ncbi:MAG TPA: hypothetical protein VF230_13910 [Acidimicrobiales bacterium]